MCDEVRKYGDNRAERAKAEERVLLVSNLMHNNQYTLDQALKCLGMSPADYQRCVELLNERQSA